jgi:hypothetical protein
MRSRHLIVGFATAFLAAMAAGAQANELITNGSFSTLSSTGTTSLIGNSGTTADVLQGWTTTSGYSFLVTPSEAQASGSGSTHSVAILNGSGSNTISFWMGAGASQFSTSPDGGNFIAQDGGYQTGTLSQSVAGLTVGDHYQLTFYQAGAQQSGYTGSTTDQWKVSLGGQVEYSDLISNISHGFSGWESETIDFTATATTEALGFFAIGTPSGVPPFALLDGVSMTDVPEPSTVALMVVGVLGLAGARRWAFKRG